LFYLKPRARGKQANLDLDQGGRQARMELQ